MITADDLDKAIEECQEGKENYATCEKLATFLTLKHHLYGNEEKHETAHSYSGSAFMNAISGKDMYKVMDTMDELMETLSVINPRLYQAVMRKLAE